MAALMDAANAALAEYKRTGKQVLVPAVPPAEDDPGHGGDYYMNPDRGLIPEWDNTFNPASWASWIPFDVHSFAPRLTQPLLVVHSNAAVNPDSVRSFVGEVSSQISQLWLDAVTQFDFYDQPGPMNAVSDAAAVHFGKL